jgi:hypothetical protein
MKNLLAGLLILGSFSALANSSACYLSALKDKTIKKYLYELQLVELCRGKTDLSTITCFKELIVKNEIKNTLYAYQIIPLCNENARLID